MQKDQVIEELNNIIDTIQRDRRKDILGIKIMVCESNWVRKKQANDSNLLIDWEDKF